MNKEKRRGGIILQVAILFALGILTTGLLTYFSEQKLRDGLAAMEQKAIQLCPAVEHLIF